MRRTCINTVDLFCGAGGASTGMELALAKLGLVHHGLAINHWQVAVDTMKANHPAIDTKQMSVEEAVPADLVPGGEVDLLWASPSCTHHSRAKGGKPRSNQLRAQPELILTWPDQLFVRRIIVENVPEFVQWGPLGRDGRPLKGKEGACFAAWVEGIRARNYEVDWRIVNCADYGGATSRRRFFLKAVRKGCGRIRWPEPTHAETPETDLWGKKLKRWRGVRECLDLDDLGRSIFEPGRNLVMNTLRRVDVGMKKFNGISFLGDESRVHSLADPLPVQHAIGNRCAVVRPFIVKLNNNADAEDIDKPLTTVLAGGQHHALCTPFIVRANKGCYAESVDKPLSSQQAHTVHHALCQPVIIDHFKNGEAHGVDEPLGAQTTHDRYSVATPIILEDVDVSHLPPAAGRALARHPAADAQAVGAGRSAFVPGRLQADGDQDGTSETNRQQRAGDDGRRHVRGGPDERMISGGRPPWEESKEKEIEREKMTAKCDMADLFGESPVSRAIERIRFFCKPGKRVCVAFSGGKDSQTVYHICKEAGVEFFAQYSVTRFEPPELWRFVREQYPDVQIRKRFNHSLVKEIEICGLPTRFARWCCKAKHAKIDGADIVIIGIRGEESPRRQSAWRMSGRKGDGTFYLCPIIDWTEEVVWSYLDSRGIPHCSLYDEGQKRIGCVCCPMTPSKMLAQAKRWPKTARAIRAGAERFVEKHRKNGFINSKGNRCADWCEAENLAEELFERWLRTGQITKSLADFRETGEETGCLFDGTGFSENDGREAGS